MTDFTVHVLRSKHNDVRVRIDDYSDYAPCPSVATLRAEGACVLVVTNSIFESMNFHHTVRPLEVES